MGVVIETSNFRLRELVEEDVTERYLSWFRDADAMKFISTAAQMDGLAELRKYVAERAGKEDVLFLGIFEKEDGKHIGNIKYEPLDQRARYATMGILIGDPSYRGKGVTTEVLRESGEWLKQHRNIAEIALGVSYENQGAMRAYEKVGFVRESTPHIPNPGRGFTTMVWKL